MRKRAQGEAGAAWKQHPAAWTQHSYCPTGSYTCIAARVWGTGRKAEEGRISPLARGCAHIAALQKGDKGRKAACGAEKCCTDMDVVSSSACCTLLAAQLQHKDWAWTKICSSELKIFSIGGLLDFRYKASQDSHYIQKPRWQISDLSRILTDKMLKTSLLCPELVCNPLFSTFCISLSAPDLYIAPH